MTLRGVNRHRKPTRFEILEIVEMLSAEDIPLLIVFKVRWWSFVWPLMFPQDWLVQS